MSKLDEKRTDVKNESVTIGDIEIWGKHAYSCECPNCRKVYAFREHLITLGWDFEKIQLVKRTINGPPAP